MDKNKRDKENNFPPKIFSLESPIHSQYIKSSIFQNDDNNNNINFNKNNFNKNNSFKNKFHRRSLTQNNGIFALNQIGYIKNDNNYENKKNEENNINNKINSSQDINNLVNKILSSHSNKYNFDSCTKRNKKNEDLEIKEKNCTEDKFIKARRKYTQYYKKVKKFNASKKNALKESKYNRYESAKNLEVNTFEAKKSKQNKSSLSFGDVDEENNEEDSNENNNDSSYISKIESKHVSMYDIDEELKELKEIGNNLKSPVYRTNNRNYYRLISSFSINNNDNDKENENNDNFKQKSTILFQLKKMASKNDNENKVNHNPIVFDDNLELSFHEDQNKKSTKNHNSSSPKIINYINDKYKIKKWLNFKNYNIYISLIDDIKNKKFCFYYKNDSNTIKKNNIELMASIGQIENIRKRKYIINDYSIDNKVNYDSRRNTKKGKIHNVNENNKNVKIENKSNKKKLILRNKKEPYNKNNNQSKIIIKKENISLKNNCRIQNTNELNKLIKEKINFLSMKNSPNVEQVFQKVTTNKNREEKKINLTFINTSLNSQKELSFNNNDLLMIRENDIFCYGGDESIKNNITYNRFYNGNNITMNNFYNNYKLNDSNNNICFNTEINNEREFLNGKNINIINAIKSKLALKLKEEIYKNKKNNLTKNNKIEINKDCNNPNDNYYKYSRQEDLNIKKYSMKNNKDKLNGLNNDFKDILIDKNLSKCSSEIINQKNINNYNCFDNFNNINNESNSNSIFLNLNPIVEQKYFEKRKNKSISINKKSNKKQNISSERLLFLNRKNYNINKKQIVNNSKNNINKLMLNNPINIIKLNGKKVNNISDKKFNSKIKNFSNSIHSRKGNNFSLKKNYNNSRNNSISKNKKHNGNNKSVENKIKNGNINKCSSGEIINCKFNKINPNYDSNKTNLAKNKLADFRNKLKKEKPSNILTKNIINTRMNIDLNGNNPSVRFIESSYKLQNKDKTKNKSNLNRTDAKKSIVIKGKINNKLK